MDNETGCICSFVKKQKQKTETKTNDTEIDWNTGTRGPKTLNSEIDDSSCREEHTHSI